MAVQRHCREILETEGFEVSCESSLGSARRFLRQKRADTILLDLFLPDGCGYELFGTSRELIEGVPIVAMTAVYQGSANARLLQLRHPFAAVISKPVRVAALVEVLRGILEGAYPEPPDWARSADEATVVVTLEDEAEEPQIIGAPRLASGSSFNSLPSMTHFVSPLDARPNMLGPSQVEEAALAWDPTGPVDADPSEFSSSVALRALSPSPLSAASLRDPLPAARANGVDLVDIVDHFGDVADVDVVDAVARLDETSSSSIERIDGGHRAASALIVPTASPTSASTAPPGQSVPSPDRITSPVQRLGASRATPLISRAQPVIQRKLPLERTMQTRYPAPPPLVEHRLSPRNPDPEGLDVPPALDPRRAPLQGRLEDVPLPVVLTRIARAQGTGSLLLRRDKIKKIVFVDKGAPVAVKSNLLYECLGQLLVRENLITEASCDQSVERLKAEGRLQGQLLVEMGVLSTANLERSLELQFNTKFRDIFTWGQGLFQFRASPLSSEVNPVVSRDPYALILDGIRSGAPSDRISIDLSPFMTQAPTLLVTRSDLKSLELTEPERDWLRLLDNRRSLGNILNVTGGPEGVYRLFYGLVCMGVMAFRPREMFYGPAI